MKKLIKLSALTMAFCALNASAKLGSSNDQVKFAGDLGYSNFCEAIVKDDVSMLKRSLRSKVGQLASNSNRVLKMLISDEGMACNGVDLVAFSEQREATEVKKFFSSKN